jgi:hypothetical protein
MKILTLFLILTFFKSSTYRELKEKLTVSDIQKVEEINKVLTKSSPDKTGSSEQLIFGIICLEMDDSMTTITANNFDIKI